MVLEEVRELVVEKDGRREIRWDCELYDTFILLSYGR
jgi:hypothetical protein